MHQREALQPLVLLAEHEAVRGAPHRRFGGVADRDLPADAVGAYICTFECTFCADCTTTKLKGVCPNCGGELLPRPRRPTAKLAKNPASTKRVVKPDGCRAP